MKSNQTRSFNNPLCRLAVLAFLFVCAAPAPGQPAIVSTVPTNAASGVPPSTPVVFTFNTAMDPQLTSAQFIDASSPFTPLTTIGSWSIGNTVLTCTPDPAFPNNTFIFWTVAGASAGGDSLEGETSGFFGTSTSSSGGNGTNAITSFVLGKTHSYNQTSAAVPVLDPDLPYSFGAITSLASNRTANAVQLTLPTGSISNLTQIPFAPEHFTLFAGETNLTSFDATFPQGDYSFNVQATSSNQLVVVDFPTSMAQPGAPHVTNYVAAQAINPSQPFALGWDPFPGGTASDFVYVTIGDVFSSTNAGMPGALDGTKTSITIPAGTFQANSNYDGSIGFYRMIAITNATGYATVVYRATTTDFTVVTSGGISTGPLVLANFGYAAGSFGFDVLCSTGQMVTVEYKANLLAGQWQTFLTTNSPGDRFRVSVSQQSTNSSRFFRARNGQ